MNSLWVHKNESNNLDITKKTINNNNSSGANNNFEVDYLQKRVLLTSFLSSNFFLLFFLKLS
jgi:hypothetical protein